jgi:hypothetical protein
MTKFKKNQKVRNQYGKVLTVMEHRGCQVFVYENCGQWYHPTKLFTIGGAK